MSLNKRWWKIASLSLVGLIELIVRLFILLFVLIFFCFVLQGGVSDWFVRLPNDYYLAANAGTDVDFDVDFISGSDGKPTGPVLVEAQIAAFCYDGDYIGLKRIIDYDTADEKEAYYLVYSDIAFIEGPMTYSEYLLLSNKLSPNGALNDWVSTTPKPAEAFKWF